MLILAEFFIPHGHCYLWKPELVGLHVISDALTALAYYSIPLTLTYFVAKRRDIPFNWIFLLFSAFIIACGTTHIIEIWTLWHPDYWLSGAIKAVTALVSLYTAGELVTLLPQALTLPTATQLEAAKTEVKERQRAERALLKEKAHLTQAQKVAHVGSWEFNLVTQEITWSEETFRIYGLDVKQPAPTVNEHWQMIYPEDRAIWETTVQQVAEGKTGELEFRIVRPDGSIRYLLGQGEPIFNAEGRVHKLFGTVLDISDRVTAQQRERLVAEISLRIRQSLELEDILNTTVQEVRQLLQTDRVLIYHFNPDWSGGVVVESVGEDWISILNSTIHDPCFGKQYAQLYQQGRVRAIANIHTAGLTPCYVELLVPLQVTACLTVPILMGETLWGLLIVHHCHGTRPWQSYEIELSQQLATQVAIALQQADLFSRVQVELKERQRIEQELRISEERYRSVVTAMSEGIVVQQANGQITACNNSAEQILGLTSQQMLGRTSIEPRWHTIYEDGSPFPGELHPAMVTLRTGEPQSNVLMGIHKPNGSFTWISINSQPLFQSGELQPYAVVTSFTDITARKQAEEALRTSEQKFRAVFNSVQDGILITDDCGYYLDANPAACTLLGLSRKEIKKRQIWLLNESEEPLQGRNHWQTLLAEGCLKGEFSFERSHRTTREVEFTAIAHFLPGLHLSVVHDITERKQSEAALRAITQQEQQKAQQLAQALKDLQRTQTQLVQNEKMVSLGQLVAGVAHEINNPTSFIYGNIYPASEYAEDLLDLVGLYAKHYPEPVPEIAEQLERIEPEFIAEDFPKLLESMKEGAYRISEIVQSLRNFSRLDEMERKPVDIHEGIDSTLLILRHRLAQQPEQSQIRIIKEYGELPFVECYPSQLNQVFMNIISNAIDALEIRRGDRDKGEGKIRVTEENFTDPLGSIPTIQISTQVVKHHWVLIRIADNGLGLTPEIQPKIFDPFFTTKPPGRGTGLGLSISYQIVVDKHGGDIKCHSVPGQGAEFAIVVPISQRYGGLQQHVLTMVMGDG